MARPTNVTDAIEQNALGPKVIEFEGQKIEQHSIEDQIKADNHAKAQTAASKKGFGIRFQKIVPPGGG